MAPPSRECPASPGDADATATFDGWHDLYEANVGWVYRLLYSQVGNRADAEDLTSEVFLAALRPLRIGATRAEVRAYLKATARTVLAQHWRRHYRIEITRLSEDAAIPCADDTLAPPGPSAATRAREVLGRLSERYRTVLDLRFLQGLQVKDTARAMGISVGNAKVLQHRALAAAAGAGLSAVGGPSQ
jgi:RNA polymerase sigma-70 factor (ECF subfamily)